MLEVAPIIRSVGADGTFFHVLDFGPVKAIAYLLGGMGLLAAQHGTQKLLDYADVGLLVMLGTAGALDDDLSIGDVAVATEVNEFQANSMAESVEGGYEPRYSGNHWPLDFAMKQALANFEFASRPTYQGWQADAAAVYAGLDIPEKATVCVPPAHVAPRQYSVRQHGDRLQGVRGRGQEGGPQVHRRRHGGSRVRARGFRADSPRPPSGSARDIRPRRRE